MSQILSAYPLSPIQKARLRGTGSDAERRSTVCAVLITNPPAVPELEKAFVRIANRHEILRACYRKEGEGEIEMAVKEALPVWLDEHILDEDLDVQSTLFERLSDGSSTTGDALITLQPFRLANGSLVIGMILPALSADASLPDLISRELAAEIAREEREEPPIQYGDLATWMQENLEQALEEDQYWHTLDISTHENIRLQPTVLPSDDTTIGAITLEFSHETKTPLSKTADPEAFLLSLWQVLLHRRADVHEVLTGVWVSGREGLEELRDAFGLIDNFLPITARMRQDETISALTARNKEKLAAVRLSKDTFFEELVQKAGRMNFGFVYQKVHSHQFERTEIRPWITPPVYPFQVCLSCVQIDNEHELKIWYDPVSFSKADAQALANQFAHLLTRSLNQSDESLPLPKLPPVRVEREEQVPNDGSEFMTALFEQSANRFPDETAVVFENNAITFDELNERANRLAHYLRGRGVKPDSLVAICLPRSVEMIAAILGILKSGGAYLPLDPDNPPGRLRKIMEDCGARWLLLDTGQVQDGVSIAGIDLSDQPTHNPEPWAGAENLAYVIYTSGSTGTPKGVEIRHATPPVLLSAMREAVYQDLPEQGLAVSLNAPVFFDASVQQFLMLCQGHCLHIVPEEVRKNSVDFLNFLATNKIQALDCTPAHLSLLLDAGLLDHPNLELTRVVSAGGPISQQDWDRMAAHGQIEFFNIYGPTEATVNASGRPILEAMIPTIGHALKGYSLYVTGPDLNPRSTGMDGELLIGGNGLARGYLRRPGLTAEKFIPDPFSSRPGERLYRTGDLARYTAHGEIQFRGRVDFQVKVHGYRIELGEVEHAMLQVPGVSHALADIRAMGKSEEPRLIGYYVSAEEVSDETFHDQMAATVPDYMIPGIFVALPNLPLTPSGKINRRALPQPVVDERVNVAPRTPIETRLAEIWCEVLGLDEISIHDNFFRLGGDSILNIQVVGKAMKSGLKLTVQQLFRAQTIANLAPEVTYAASPAAQNPRTGSAPLAPIQKDFFSRNLVKPHYYNQSLVLESNAPLERARLEKALTELCSQHEALRLRFNLNQEMQKATLDNDSERLFHLEYLALEENERTSTWEALIKRAPESLNIENGPLMAVYHVTMGQDIRLLWVIHHLAVDTVSWRFLAEDLEVLLTGETLTPPMLSWSRWSEELAAFAASGKPQESLPFWRQQIEYVPLPRDREASDNLGIHTKSIQVHLSKEDTFRLLHDVIPVFNTQIEDMLLAALVSMLGKETGRYAASVHMESHGREALHETVDPSRTIGWFTSLYPVTLDLSNIDPQPDRIILNVKEQLKAVRSDHIDFGVLRWLHEESGKALTSDKTPDMIFNYLGQLDRGGRESRLFSLANDPTPATQASEERHGYLLDLQAMIVDERFTMTWRYDTEAFDDTTIGRWSENYQTSLTNLIAFCLEPGQGGRAPSDYPLARLSWDRLEAIQETHSFQDTEDIYPMTPMQQGMLFHMNYTPDSKIYAECVSCLIEGDMDREIFRKAWQIVTRRQAVLRTVFWVQGREALQIVLANHDVAYRELDLTALHENERRQKVAEIEEEELSRGFIPQKEPPFRVTLIREGEQRHRLLLLFHHVLMDGWAFQILIREVATAYVELRNGKKPDAVPPATYRDYIRWLQAQDQEKAFSFWRKLLRGFQEPNQVTAPPKSNEEPAPAWRRYSVTERLTTRLKQFASNKAMTVNNLLQGAWSVLISRYSGKSDVVFGVTVSGRPPELPDSERMLGLFINTLPLRIDAGGGRTVSQFLADIQEQQNEAQAYEYCSLAEVQRLAGNSGSELFETLLVFENFPLEGSVKQGIADLSIQEIKVFEEANYPLVLMASLGDKLELKIMHDQNRLSAEAADRLQGHLDQLLEGLVEQEQRDLGELHLLSSHEYDLIVADWNDTARPWRRGFCLHHLFEERAEAAPDNIAISDAQGVLTYEALNQKANQLAHYLRKQGLRPGELVPVCFSRRSDMAVGLLAILKAGAAYVPMEQRFPDDRIKYILETTRASFVMTHGELADRFGGTPTQIVAVDDPHMLQGPSTNPDVPVDAGQLAYIIFTSGSTGKPKGVVLQHRPVVNLIEWVNRTQNVGPADKLLFITSLCFDLSVYDLFGIFAAGGQVRVASSEDLEEPRALVNLIQTEHITFWDSAPAALQQLVPFFPPPGQGVASLRLVYLSGDWIPLTLQPALKASFPNVNVVGLGGATEAAIWSNHFPIEQISPSWKSIPYGKPIQNARYHVLDAHLHPVPEGVPGDLYIGGDCLSWCYHGQPRLTAQQYVPDHLSGKSGAVLYRTGDKARYFPRELPEAGNLEFLGRVDQQVKIRGYRIELGEIESVLVESKQVREAVVLARENLTGEKRLVAYVQLKDPEAGVANLEQEISRKLPAYMMPSAIVVLDQFPVTANGKLDRKALSSPEELADANDIAPPRNPLEKQLLTIWLDVLGLESLGIHDNFFIIGGHSLLAAQVVARVQADLDMELSLRTLFEAPTVALFALKVQEARQGRKADVPAVVAMNRAAQISPYQGDGFGGDLLDLPVSFAQMRLWLVQSLDAGSAAYNMPLTVLMEGRLEVDILRRCLEEIVRRHEVLRTRFPEREGQPVQVISAEIDVPLQVHEEAPDTVDQCLVFLNALALKPFDLECGPLFRVHLCPLSQERHVLLVNMHHIVSDGWSVGLLQKELATLYRAFLAGEASPLPPIPVQYADFAAWQSSWLSGESLDHQAGYWKSKLSGHPERLTIPMDGAAETITDHRTHLFHGNLDNKLTESIQTLSRAQGTTLFMTLLAAFKLLLHRLSGQKDILVGTPIAGRPRPELEDLIGCFLNTLVLRTSVADSDTFEDLLAQVRETMLEAFEHQDIPFEKVVEIVQPERDITRPPFFDIMFNFVNTPNTDVSLPGLELKQLSLKETDSKFFMDLYIWEEADRLSYTMVYKRALFSEERIATMMEQFAHLLHQICATPDQKCRTVSLVTPAARTQLPTLTTPLEKPYQEPIGEAFARVAEQYAEHTAVTRGERRYDYATLKRQADAIAEVLTARGVGQGQITAIYGPRRFGLIASIMAVVKHGSVLLMLDPALPEKRLHTMVERADARFLIQIGEEGPFTPHDGLMILNVDDMEGTPGSISREGMATTGRNYDPDTAYVFFTSGTSGTPKGVMGSKQGLAHFIAWQRETFRIGPDDRCAQLTGLSFDVVLRDIFLPITSGAALCLPVAAETIGSLGYLDWIAEERISVLHTVPALLSAWMAGSTGDYDFSALRWIFFAGEPLNAHVIAHWRSEYAAETGLINLYGPTETTLAKCFYQIPAEPPPGVQPVGVPLPNTQALVLSPEGDPLGVGETGEIIIRTPFRSNGYLDPETADQQRFQVNPTTGNKDDLLYFTGDLGRYRPDFTLDILGRVDSQIKIRGFRVEPSEVTSVLRRHEAISDAAVVNRPHQNGDPRLAGYFVATGEPPEQQELAIFLRRWLPDAMIPSFLIPIDTIPLTANGKLDHRALPEPVTAEPETWEAPSTEAEKQLATIWEEVLDIEGVGATDNFFQLGGHSLNGATVMYRIRDTFDVELTLASIFQEPTIRGLARQIQLHQLEDVDQTEVSSLYDELNGLSQEEMMALLAEGEDGVPSNPT